MYESVPYSLKMSSTSPVAAEEENILTIVSGTSCTGNPICTTNLLTTSAKKSKNPEALNTPTATISPINVGIILITVKNPCLAPFIKCS